LELLILDDGISHFDGSVETCQCVDFLGEWQREIYP